MQIQGKGIKIVVTILTSFIILILLLFFLLQYLGIYDGKIEGKINEVIKHYLPIEIHFNKVTGNPITGYSMSPFYVLHNSRPVLQADRLYVNLSLSNIIQGKLTLSSLLIENVSADYAEIAKIKSKQKKSTTKTTLPIKKISIKNGNLYTPYGNLQIEKANFFNKNINYRVNLNGNYNNKKISINASSSEDSNKPLHATILWGDSNFQVSGLIHPELSAQIQYKNTDLKELPRYIPALAKIPLSGLSNGEITTSYINNHWVVSGDINVTQGEIWKLKFNNIASSLNYEGNIVSFRNISGDLFGSDTDGNISLIFSKNKPLEFKIQTTIKSIALQNWKTIFKTQNKLHGKINVLSIDVSGSLKDLLGNITLNSNKLSYNNIYKIDALTGKIDFSNINKYNVLFLGKYAGGDYSIQGDINRENLHMGISAHASGIDMKSVSSQIERMRDVPVSGQINTVFDLSGNPGQMLLRGHLSSDQILLHSYDEQISKGLLGFEYDFKKLTIPACEFQWRDASIRIHGAVHPLEQETEPQLSFSGTCTRLPLSNLSDHVKAIKDYNVQGEADATFMLMGPLNKPAVHYSLSIAALKSNLTPLSLTQLKMTGAAEYPKIRLDEFTFVFGEKPIYLKGELFLPTSETSDSLNLEGTFTEAPLDALRSFTALPDYISGNLSGYFNLKKQSEEYQATLKIKDSQLRIRNLLLSDIQGTVQYSPQTIQLYALSSKLAGGHAHLKGNISPGKENNINLVLEAKSLDMGRVMRVILPAATGAQGNVDAVVNLQGTIEKPQLKATLGIRRFFSKGFYLPTLNILVNADTSGIHFEDISAPVGKGFLKGTTRLYKQENQWHSNVKIRGENMNLRVLSSYLPSDTQRNIKGTLNFIFAGEGALDSFQGKGLFSSPSLRIKGAKITGVKAPFNIQEGYVTIEESTGNFYGGKIAVQLAADLISTKWGGHLSILSADTSSIIHDILPGNNGSITGKTDFTLQLAGDSKRTTLLDGNGKLVMRNGELSGFEGLTALSKALKNAPLLFQSVISNFVIDGKNIYILPGSRITAPIDHPAYRYVLVDGSANAEKGIDLSFIGNVNLKALNIFVNALQGALSSGIEHITDKQSLISDILGGAIKGFSSNQFRDVSFSVTGKPEGFAFHNFAVAPMPTYNFKPSMLDDPGEAVKIKEQKLMISLEIPIGNAHKNKTGQSIGRQVQGQVLQQALQSIIMTQ